MTTSQFTQWWDEAVEAADAALAAAIPTPMVVTGGGQQWFVSEGPCGFASVRFAGNTAFGRWAKSTGRATKAWDRGLQVWVRGGGQSIARKEAWAKAFAKVLQSKGVAATWESRLD